MQTEELRKFPKIELHCHLDGSLSAEALKRIVRESDYDMEPILNRMRVKRDSTDLADYLSCFASAMPFLQTKENLRIAAYELIRQAAAEGVIYMEVRFAPMYHGCGGMTQTEAVKAVLGGLEEAEKDFGVKSRLLLCMMRGKTSDRNEETLSCALQMRDYGVAGIDLAGNEAAYPPQLYRSLFLKAQEKHIPFTIHAGECGSVENVRVSVEMGAGRIGHGVAIANDEEMKRVCREKGVVLEMCPVSNLQTGAVNSLAEYPWAKMRAQGVPVTVNTDNRTVSDTSLLREWQTLSDSFGPIGAGILKQAAEYAVDAAFLPWTEKEGLRKTIRDRASACAFGDSCGAAAGCGR